MKYPSIPSATSRTRANSVFRARCFGHSNKSQPLRASLLGCITLLAAALPATALAAELIPSDRLIDWTPGVNVGVRGGIPTNRTRIIDVSKPPYNADTTGASDASGAINNAIGAAGAGDIVYLPAGTYKMASGWSGGLYGKSEFTIRGAGNTTILRPTVGGSTFWAIGTGSSYAWFQNKPSDVVTGGLQKGSNRLTLANTNQYEVGQLVQIGTANDDSFPMVSVFGFELANQRPLRKQMSTITAKTATTLTISPGLYGDYSSTQTKMMPAFSAAGGVGIENLNIDMSGSSAQYAIFFSQATNCWISGVTITKSTNYGIGIFDSVFCEVRKCYVDGSGRTGSNGAGFLVNTVSASLFEDNILVATQPDIEVNYGSSGNVFAYNFIKDGQKGIDSNHGPHNSYNLYEGNISPNLQADGYYGSVSHDTIFRNWFTAVNNGAQSFALSLNRFTRYYTLIGNLFQTAGFNWTDRSEGIGTPNIGNGSWTGTAQPSLGRYWKDWKTSAGADGFQELDLDVEKTLIRKANHYIWNNSIPAAEKLQGETLPASLYRGSKPDWFGSLPWPAFDPNSPNRSFEAIPAGYRFVHGIDFPQSGTKEKPSNVKIQVIR